MASWIVHLRITDKLLDQIPDLSSADFVVGNIAPDSSVPNEDWSAFTPSGDVSHFKTTDADGLKDIHVDRYVEQYFSVIQRRVYNKKQRSFYLGYLTHLLTDMLWANGIVRPSLDRFRSLYDEDRKTWIWALKNDWYDLDFLYIKKNPDFRAFSILFLWVLEKNNKVRRCYEKHGFRFDGTKREVTYGKLLVQLRYVLDLCL